MVDHCCRALACRGPRHVGPASLLAVALALGCALRAAGGTGAAPPASDLDPQKAGTPLSAIAGAVPAGPSSTDTAAESPDVRAHCEGARARIEAKEYDQAIIELDAALDAVPSAPYEILYLLAQARRAQGRYGEARLAAEHALVYRPGSVDIHVLLGRLDRQQKRPEAAIAQFRAATLAAEAEPDNARVAVAWYELGNGLTEAGYLWAAAEALEHFDRAVWEEHPALQRDEEVAAILKDHPYGAIEQRLELWRRLDRPEELARVAAWAFKTRPAEPYLERLYVHTLLDAGQATAAFDFCRQRLTADAAAPAATALLTLAVETGRAAGRLNEWVAGLAQDVAQGRQLDLAEHLARRLERAADYSASVPLWRALAAAEPAAPDAAWALASALKDSGDLSAALGSLIEFVRRNADSAGADMPPDRLATWMRSFQATDDFLRLVKDLTARDDCDAATYTVLGATAAAAGQTELAERLLAAALEQRPNFALAHVAWARMLLAEYRWQDAAAHAEQALATVPDLAAAHFLRGEAFAGLDEHDRAESEYKAALERKPRQAAYALALARFYRGTGKPLAAQRYFQQAWSMDHTQAAAVEELVDCYLESGKVDIARESLQEAEASDVPDDVLRRVRTTLRFAQAPMQAAHLAELARELAEHPDDFVTGLKLAAGLYLNQRADEAYDVLQKIQPRAGDDERLKYLLIRVHLHRLENDAALTLLDDAVHRYPRRLNLLRLLADADIADFRIDEARRTLQRLLELETEPDQRDQIRKALLATYREFSEFDAALELVEQWLTETPDNKIWQRAKLQLLVEAGREGQAVAQATERLEPATRRFEDVRDRYKGLAERLRSNPDDADLQAQLENLRRELGLAVTDLYERRDDYVQICTQASYFEPAEEHLRAWLSDEPEQPQLQDWLVDVLLAAKRGAAALEVIGTLTPRNPTDVVKVLIWRARAKAQTGEREAAVGELTTLLEETYIRENPAVRAQIRQELLTLLVDAQDYDRAVALCDRWLAAVPAGDKVGHISALTLKRLVLGTTDREDALNAVMLELLALQPYDPGVNNDLGYTWVEHGEQLERALGMIKLAVAAEPQNAAYLDSLGWAYYKSGDFDAARKFLARSVRLRNGQDATVYDHLGDAEARLGSRDAARSAWRRALGLLEDSEAPRRSPRDTRLIASLRGKLAALERSSPPAVAPTAAEQKESAQP